VKHYGHRVGGDEGHFWGLLLGRSAGRQGAWAAWDRRSRSDHATLSMSSGVIDPVFGAPVAVFVELRQDGCKPLTPERLGPLWQIENRKRSSSWNVPESPGYSRQMTANESCRPSDREVADSNPAESAPSSAHRTRVEGSWTQLDTGARKPRPLLVRKPGRAPGHRRRPTDRNVPR